jgi:hypothetical protein
MASKMDGLYPPDTSITCRTFLSYYSVPLERNTNPNIVSNLYLGMMAVSVMNEKNVVAVKVKTK